MFITDINGKKVYRNDGYIQEYHYKITYDYWYACFPYKRKNEYITLEYDAETEEGKETLIEELKDKHHAMKDKGYPLHILELERME